MSYILDALKRADSEREREREDVPGLHSKTDPWIAPDEVRKGRSQPQTLIWAVAAAGLLIVLGSLWWVLTRQAAPAGVQLATAPAPVQAAPVAVQQAAPPPAVAPVPAPAPVARALLPLARPARAVEPAAIVPSEQAAVQIPAPVSPPSSPSPLPTPAKPKAQAAPAPAPIASAATSPEARLYALSELPEDVRAGLPTLTVGGAMYSQTPANRMLIINGQVVREGDTLAPGLVLEQIKLKSAVLKVKGLRYGISY